MLLTPPCFFDWSTFRGKDAWYNNKAKFIFRGGFPLRYSETNSCNTRASIELWMDLEVAKQSKSTWLLSRQVNLSRASTP